MYSPLTGVILIFFKRRSTYCGLTHLRLARELYTKPQDLSIPRCVAIARKKASSSASKQSLAMPSRQSRGPALLLPKNFGAHEGGLGGISVRRCCYGRAPTHGHVVARLTYRHTRRML